LPKTVNLLHRPEEERAALAIFFGTVIFILLLLKPAGLDF
jgi:hypothetical protein